MSFSEVIVRHWYWQTNSPLWRQKAQKQTDRRCLLLWNETIDR